MTVNPPEMPLGGPLGSAGVCRAFVVPKMPQWVPHFNKAIF